MAQPITVNVYEEDTTTLNCGPLSLADLFEDDEEGYREARGELERTGRYWLGGGSAPLYYVTRAR